MYKFQNLDIMMRDFFIYFFVNIVFRLKTLIFENA